MKIDHHLIETNIQTNIKIVKMPKKGKVGFTKKAKTVSTKQAKIASTKQVKSIKKIGKKKIGKKKTTKKVSKNKLASPEIVTFSASNGPLTKKLDEKELSKKKSAKKVLNTSTNLFLFFDVETSGLPQFSNSSVNRFYHYSDVAKYNSSRIVQICWMVYDYYRQQLISHNYVIKPSGDFNIVCSDIHGITNEHVNEHGQNLSDVFNQLAIDLQNVKFSVTHNLFFVKNILYSELYRHGRQDIIDKLEATEQTCTGLSSIKIVKLPNMKKPNLGQLYEHCFKKQMLNPHNAYFDTQHIAECFFKLIDK